jgi:hypothetical protein
MLATFLLRLACGMIGALLVLSPAQVAPRFYRTQFLTVLGLTVAAGVLLHDAVGLLLGALVAATLLSFLGSFVWSLEGAPAGRTMIVLDMLVLAAALALVQRFLAPEETAFAGPFVSQLTSAALLGAAMSAMLMGHSYLIAPAMSITPLLRLLQALFAATLLRMLVAGFGVWCWTADAASGNLANDTLLLLPVRWGLGFLGPLILGWMAWESAKIRSTQSATGILYVVVIFCFLGELTGQLLQPLGPAL